MCERCFAHDAEHKKASRDCHMKRGSPAVVADPRQESGRFHKLLRRTKPFAIVIPVSSMSPLIWIQPATSAGFFLSAFCRLDHCPPVAWRESRSPPGACRSVGVKAGKEKGWRFIASLHQVNPLLEQRKPMRTDAIGLCPLPAQGFNPAPSSAPIARFIH
ncbi:hypothetical protein KZJ38_02735 [Paraburkholderia edwinii]|uniref:Uncharacterized protein n=1 Tax=Paraburkholderia edwinii TaxID=2861782 RepID=A0ABX8UJX1_9BURK|nr:hypothetical protein [Paraburkholderia edwinii]QYD69318.1 hypothetical protein KZJ38_02735 [Paraburkholderia edwinii]